MEGDLRDEVINAVFGEISIHALRVEGDIENVRKVKSAIVFLSTPSGWRATEHITFNDLFK